MQFRVQLNIQSVVIPGSSLNNKFSVKSLIRSAKPLAHFAGTESQGFLNFSESNTGPLGLLSAVKNLHDSGLIICKVELPPIKFNDLVPLV